MERVEQRELPGNDASWYREMVADQKTTQVDTEPSPPAIEPESETIDAVPLPPAEPPAEAADEPDAVSTQEDPVADATAVAEEGPLEEPKRDEPEIENEPPSQTPLMTAVPQLEADDSTVENTSEMVGQMWTARDSDGPLDGWEPGEMDKKVASSRSFRWPTLIGVVAILALIAVGLVVLPSITENRADAHRDMMTSALYDLRSELPATQASLAIATDPASAGAQLSELTTQLTMLAANASALDQATQAELPNAPPLTSSAPIDELEPIRQSAEPLGTIAITIQRRIANLVEYRTLMSGFLVLPDLPATADNSEQAELRVELASAQAESAAILADLPSDVSLEGHSTLARDLNERFATWQVDYLEALRTGDAATARALIAELNAAQAELDQAMVTPLAQVRRQTDVDLIDLARDIDEVMAMASAVGETS